MEEVEEELSKIVGLDALKSHLRNWSKGLLLDQTRRKLGLTVGPRGPFHMVFMGNPGTGKSMAAQVAANLLRMRHIILRNSVVEVKAVDFVTYDYSRKRRKIKEAQYGILFVDEAHKLVPEVSSDDNGLQALDMITDFMDQNEDSVCIFAGEKEAMKRFISENEGVGRRMPNIFYFDDYSCEDLAKILHLKISKADTDSFLYGFKLHASCTLKAVAEGIEKITDAKRKELNGGLVDKVLVKAKENLDSRIDIGCDDIESLGTITMNDLLAGLRSFRVKYIVY